MNPANPCVLLFVRRVLSEKLLAKEEDEDDIAIGKFFNFPPSSRFFLVTLSVTIKIYIQMVYYMS